MVSGAEFLASRLDAVHRLGVVRARQTAAGVERAVEEATIARLAAAEASAGGAALPSSALLEVLGRMQRLAGALAEIGLGELEVNPFVVSNGRLVAVDALATLRDPESPTLPRPVEKLPRLLAPRSVAIAGVSSEHVNPGRVIVGNLLRDGFPPDAIRIIKPGVEQIDGCAAVPSLAALDRPIDLLVLAVAAPQASAMALDAIAHGRTESIVLIPGGFEEKGGSDGLAAGVRAALDEARATPSCGPLVLGGNCLGFRSRAGRCNTLFIPEYKLPVPDGHPHPLALVSQSGAFALARADRWGSLSPAYVITTGNQIDLTIGDCLAWLKDEGDVRVFAVYVEGFKPLDGARTLDAAAEIARSGCTLVLYRAGRTPAGARASASHTASIAGDYLVTRALFEHAGAIVADDLEGFEDLVRLAVALDGKRPAGRRLAAVSNAGFECVVIADRLGPLELATISPATRGTIEEVLRQRRLDGVVDVHNPMDLTPMADAGAYEGVVRAFLADGGVDLAVVGCVPLTPALETLPPGQGHQEDLGRDQALAARLGRVARGCAKPLVLVVDAGPRYDAFAAALDAQGLLVFRRADSGCSPRSRRGWPGALTPGVSSTGRRSRSERFARARREVAALGREPVLVGQAAASDRYDRP